MTSSKLAPGTLNPVCPSGTTSVGGLCFETAERPAAPYASAIETCSGVGRLLPQASQLIALAQSKGLTEDPVIRDRIGALAADIEVARLFQMRNSKLIEQAKVPLHEAAMGKVFASELQERLGQAALDILGTGGLLSEDAEGAPVGEMEYVLRHAIMGMIGGGTNEIQRNVIAQRGLELPR